MFVLKKRVVTVPKLQKDDTNDLVRYISSSQNRQLFRFLSQFSSIHTSSSQWRLQDLVAGASGVATYKVGGQVLRSTVSFKTVFKRLKTRIDKSTIYLHEGEVYGGGFPFLSWWRGVEGAVPLPENFLTPEWKMARFGAFWVLFLQTAVI